MSSTTSAPAAPTAAPLLPDSWGLWRRQIAAILRLELRKSFLGRGGLWLYLLAAAPVALFVLLNVLPMDWVKREIGGASLVYAGVFQGFILRIVIYLAGVAVFGGLIRREILDRSLHFYFLAPMRRELLVIGKYLCGVVVTFLVFGLSTLVSYLLALRLGGSGSVSRFLFHGPGLAHLGAYLLVTALACLGYGAVFLAFGSFFKSPALPALAVFGWESIHFLLPPFLKQLSVVHYLQSLCPVPIPEGPFAVLADAPAAWVAVLGPILLSAVLVVLSAWRVRRMEVHYDSVRPPDCRPNRVPRSWTRLNST
jgi:ABC-type transport system involved in multi-copper enzyme maturation permease subunit